MLQERRGVTVTSSTTSSISSDISVIHQKNKTELIQDYFDDAKRYTNVYMCVYMYIHVPYYIYNSTKLKP